MNKQKWYKPLVYCARIFLFLSFILVSVEIHSQAIQFRAWNNLDTTYEDATTFPFDAVADDFGPRRVTSNYHLGIDYNSEQDDGNDDMWDLIVAPEAGTIVDVNRLWTNQFSYKQICYEAGDHRYILGHVYDNSSQSYSENNNTIILKNMLDPLDDFWAQIFIVNGDTIVLGQNEGFVELSGDTLATSIDVTVGMPLVPLGNSSTPGAHLHLNTIPLTKDHSTGTTDYNANPLQYIDYNKANYLLKLYCQENDSTFIPQYSSLPKTYSPMALKVEMETTVSGAGNKRYDHLFDVDKVKFYIKQANEQEYGLIKGPFKESEIIYGGVLGEDQKNHPDPNFGNWTTTGVDSRAYNGGYPDQPYDIFHYSDFITRIHREDTLGVPIFYSDIPSHSRYNDGPYLLKAAVYDIRDSIHEGPTDTSGILQPIEDTLDNFMPFIEKLVVFLEEDSVYNGGWNPVDPRKDTINNGFMIKSIGPNYPVYSVYGYDSVIIKVYPSEPMASLFIQLPDFSTDTLFPYDVNASHDEFKFQLPAHMADSLQQDSCYRIWVNGSDFSSNPLLNMQSYLDDNIQKIPIPKRVADNGNTQDWIDYDSSKVGWDKFHTFCFVGCTPSGLTSEEDIPEISRSGNPSCTFEAIANILTRPTENGNNGEVEILYQPLIPGLFPVDSVIVFDEAGNIVQAGTSLFILGIPEGLYCFKVVAGCCTFEDCFYLNACPTSSLFLNRFPIFRCFDDTQSVELELGGNPIPANFTIQWSDGVTTATRNVLPGDSLFVTVSSPLGCIYEKEITLPSVFNPINVSFNIPNPYVTCHDGTIEAMVSGGGSPYTYHWSTGDSSSIVNGLNAGLYHLSVTDYWNCEMVYEVELFSISDQFSLDSIVNFQGCGESEVEHGKVIFSNESNDSIYIILIREDLGVELQFGPFTDSIIEIGGLFASDYTYKIFGVDQNGGIDQDCIFKEGNFELCCCFEDTVPPPPNGYYVCEHQEPREPFSFNEIKSFPSPPNFENGSIHINPSGGGGGAYYYVSWYKNGNLMSGENGYGISSLQPGVYKVIVDDGCNIYSKEWELNGCLFAVSDSFNLQLDPKIECDSITEELDFSAVATVEGYEPMYYEWSNGVEGTGVNEIHDLDPGMYSVTVTDAAGCTDSMEVDVIPVEVLEIEPACESSNNGYVRLKVNNPGLYSIDVEYDFALCEDCDRVKIVNGAQSDTIEFLAPDLESGEYTFHIIYGDCHFTYDVTVPEELYENVYSHSEEINNTYYCIYDKVCKGEIIAENAKVKTAFLREDPNAYENCNEWPYVCPSTEVVCNNEVVDIIYGDRVLMRGYEANQLLNDLYFSGGYYEFGPCDIVYVCQNDPSCAPRIIGFFGGVYKGREYLDDDCYRIKCKVGGIIPWFANFTVCGDEYVPPELQEYLRDYWNRNPTNNEEEDCTLITKSMQELIHAMDELEDIYGTQFTESELYFELLYYKDISARYCANITYCKEDLSFVSTDIEQYECKHFGVDGIEVDGNLIGATCVPQSNSYGTGAVVWCLRNDCESEDESLCVYQKLLIYDSIPDLYEINSNDPNIELASLLDDGQDFVRLSPVYVNDSSLYYNAVNSKNGSYKFRKLNLPNKYFEELDSIMYFLTEVEKNNFLWIAESEVGNEYQFHVLNDESGYQVTSLISNSDIINFDVEEFDTLLYISMRGANEARYDEMQLVDSIASFDLYMVLNRRGQLLDYTAVPLNGGEIGTHSSKIYSQAEINHQQLDDYFENNSHVLYDQYQRQLVGFDLSPTSNIHYKLLGVTKKYYIIEVSTDSLQSFDENIVLTPKQKLVYFKGQEGNNSFYTHLNSDTSGDSIQLNDAVEIDNDRIAVALTFSSEIYVDSNSIYQSRGENDILILYVDSSTINAQQFGSENNEMIEDIAYNDFNTLFMGGIIEGNDYDVQVGEKSFIKVGGVNDRSNPFLSYLFTDSTLGVVNSGAKKSSDHVKQEMDNSYKLYPNPTQDLITIISDKELVKGTYNIEIYDINGSKVSTLKDYNTGTILYNKVNVSYLTSGFYYVIITTQDGKQQLLKFVKQ